MQEDSNIAIDLTTPQVKFRRRSSFFKLAPKTSASKENGSEMKDYLKKLEAEEKDWVHVMRKHMKKARDVAASKIELDISMLSQERQDYLAQGYTAEAYVNDLENFQDRVSSYIMKKDWIERQLINYQERIDGRLLETALSKLSNC